MPSLDSLLTLLVGLTFGVGIGFVLCWYLVMGQIDKLRTVYIQAMRAHGIDPGIEDLPWMERLFPSKH